MPLGEAGGSSSIDMTGTGTIDASLEFRDWRIDGEPVYPVKEEIRNWQELTLIFRANREQRDNALKPLDSSSGKIEIVEISDGSYKVIGRADADTEVSLDIPARRAPLRVQTEYHISEYSETITDQAADIYEVEITLVGDGPKSGGAHGTVTASNDEWHFAFADGEVATDRVGEEVSGGGSTVGGKRSVSVTCSLDQAAVIEESLNRMAAVRMREIPDAQNIAEDKNPNSRNTVTVTAPSNRDPNERIIESGDYVVEEWETSLINDSYVDMMLELVPV